MCLDLINITTDFLFSLRLSLKGMLKPWRHNPWPL